MGSCSKLLSIQPQKWERHSHSCDKYSQILELSQPTVAHQALLLVLCVHTHSSGLQTHITLFLEKVFASIAAVSYQPGVLMLLLLPPWYFSEFSFIPSRVHNLWLSLPCFLSFPGWQLTVSAESLLQYRGFFVSLGNNFPETNSPIFPFQCSILTLEFHIPKEMFLSNHSFPPHSAAVLTMLFLHYFSYVLFIVLNQPFVRSAVLLRFVDIPGP